MSAYMDLNNNKTFKGLESDVNTCCKSPMNNNSMVRLTEPMVRIMNSYYGCPFKMQIGDSVSIQDLFAAMSFAIVKYEHALLDIATRQTDDIDDLRFIAANLVD